MTDGADEESVEPKASQPRPSEQKMASGSFALNLNPPVDVVRVFVLVDPVWD